MNVMRLGRQAIRRLMAAVLPRRLFFVQGECRGMIHLTFDDGPHPEHTPALLDVLQRERVSATFFVIGRRAAESPELVRRIVTDGHALGHHTYSHSDPSVTSAARMAAEVEQTGEVLRQIVGFSPTLFRPPHGKMTFAKFLRLWRIGMTVALWNVDSRDFVCVSAGELRQRLREHDPRAGDVFLFHDNRPYAYEVLPEFIAWVRAAGLTFAALPERVGRQADPASCDPTIPAPPTARDLAAVEALDGSAR